MFQVKPKMPLKKFWVEQIYFNNQLTMTNLINRFNPNRRTVHFKAVNRLACEK